MLVHGTENMAAVYCAWGADSGGQLSLEMEGFEANVAGGRGFDEQHRVDRWKGKCAGVGDRRSPATRPVGAFMVERNRSPGKWIR
jgi:hypothetical protein